MILILTTILTWTMEEKRATITTTVATSLMKTMKTANKSYNFFELNNKLNDVMMCLKLKIIE
eukprot:m.158172 g.158172  ORF g.158172 m.158172 type:complete len:62 (-) comp13351_c5_seq4:8-193(-)